MLIGNSLVAQKLGTLKNKYFYVGVDPNEFAEIATYGKQRNMNWCWAACTQMVLNYYEISVEQEQVVKKALGKLIDQPADPDIMFRALNGWEIDVRGNHILVNSNFYATDLLEITTFLATKKPLIVGLHEASSAIGHAYVLIGIFYEKIIKSDGSTIHKPHSVQLVDPWPDNESIIDISWSEFVEKLHVSYKVWVN